VQVFFKDKTANHCVSSDEKNPENFHKLFIEKSEIQRLSGP
jgi:hypothetical protein